MARAIDAERLSNELKAYRQQYFGYGWHNEYAVLGQCLSLIDAQPTLTPPNEPLMPCDACMYNPPSSMGGKPCCICPAGPPERQEDT